ncbi:hypothetical protein [Actinomadura formosensis]|uniref:hypothetical protein n=1 Tax=Actinomadura formosensis TaxID=60706 RepID=UPI000B2A1B23|nr:hypothetical protein [Actinomadura formosensis]
MEGASLPLPDVHLWSEQRTVDDWTAAAFRERIRREGAPHHLAKYNRGVYEFAVDVLDDPALAAAAPDASADRRSRYQAAEQQLAFMMTALDRELGEAETGRLIRMVLHTEQGALFSIAVTPKNYVLGIVFGVAAAEEGGAPPSLPRVALVRDADVVVSELGNALRDRMGLPRQNPGGWLTLSPEPEDAGTDEPAAGTGRLSSPHRWGAESACTDRMAALLNPAELIYMALVRDGRVVEETDLWSHERVVETWLPEDDPESRRSYYRRLAGECGLYARQLGQIARLAMRGRMLRIVLDVEQGAIYHYRLGPTEYLVGVTLNQKRVSQADEKIGDLAAELSGEMFRTQW